MEQISYITQAECRSCHTRFPVSEWLASCPNCEEGNSSIFYGCSKHEVILVPNEDATEESGEHIYSCFLCGGYVFHGFRGTEGVERGGSGRAAIHIGHLPLSRFLTTRRRRSRDVARSSMNFQKYFSPWELERAIARLVDDYNHRLSTKLR